MDPTLFGFQVASQILLFVVLVVAATTDILYRRVYNWLTYPAIAFGLTLGWCQGLLTSHLMGFSLAAGLFGLAALSGGVGAGDWKLVSAIGAIKGYPFILYGIFYSTLLGAVLAIGVLAYHGRILQGLRRSVRRMFFLSVPDAPPEDPIKIRIPYGVSIAFGTLLAWGIVEQVGA